MGRNFALLGLGTGIIGVAALMNGCSSSGGGGSNLGSTNSSVSGKLASLSVSSMNQSVGTLSTKTVTHVMAVSPSTSNAERFIAAVGSDGTFSLGVNSGKPYLIVFVSQDGTLTGPDMIVGIVRVAANQLDTLPLAQTGNVALGDVSVNGTTATATPSTSVSDLLGALGVTSSEASFIGSLDDLALRLANPDVDGNGVIDATEDKNFSMDWHVRAATRLSGSDLKITDIENQFADPANVTLQWTLGSAYALYPQSYDNVDYVANSGVSTTLQNGGAFSDTGTSVHATSMSSGTFSNMRQWGPDYNMTSQELGASDATATFKYTLGSASKVLTFSNVRTRLKTDLNADGTVLPFIKVNTTGGKITGIEYKWMKKSGSTWAQATATEVGLIAQPAGAYLMLYTYKTGGTQKGLAFKIPASSATGTINIGDAAFYNQDVVDPNNVTLDDVCSSAMSYDDKMGLRLFAGAPAPKTGVTACN